MKKNRKAIFLIVTIFASVLLIGSAIPVKVYCGVDGYSCASAPDEKGEYHVMYEIEPFGIKLLETVIQKDLSIQYLRDYEKRIVENVKRDAVKELEYQVILEKDDFIVKSASFENDHEKEMQEYPPFYVASHTLSDQQKNDCSYDSLSPTSLDVDSCQYSDYKLYPSIEESDYVFRIEKNNIVLWEKSLYYGTYNPLRYVLFKENSFIVGYDDISVQNGNGSSTAHVLINGEVHVGHKHDLQNVYKPIIFGDSLGYIGDNSENEVIFVYNDEKYNLGFYEIINPSCCEPAVLQIINNNEEIMFYAKKDEVWHHVIIEVQE